MINIGEDPDFNKKHRQILKTSKDLAPRDLDTYTMYHGNVQYVFN